MISTEIAPNKADRIKVVAEWQRWKSKHKALFDSSVTVTESDIEEALWNAFLAGWKNKQAEP